MRRQPYSSTSRQMFHKTEVIWSKMIAQITLFNLQILIDQIVLCIALGRMCDLNLEASVLEIWAKRREFD